MRIKLPLFPKSLAGRVFALYAANLLLFVAAGLFLFYNYQFNDELESAQETATVLGEVVAQSASDSAVIGDYDAIKRTLQQAVRNPMLGSASYIDVAGGIMTVASSVQLEGDAPDWLARRVGDRLPDVNNVIKVGGRDYGVLRLRFAPQTIAAVIWKLTWRTLVISAVALLVGLALIRFSLRRWLGGLERIRQFDWDLTTRTAQEDALGPDAPVEIREAVDSFRRAGAALQTQRETAAVTLNAVADGVITTDDRGRILYANPAAVQMLRVDAAAMLQRDIRSVVPGFFAGAGSTRLDGWTGRRIEAADGPGETTVLDAMFSVIRDADGTIIGHVLACRDVTATQAYEDRLRSELETRQAAMRALRDALAGMLPEASLGELETSDTDLEAVSHLVADLVREREASRRELDNRIFALDQHASVSIADPAGNITYANAKFSEITGYSVEELLRSNHRITASGLHPPEFYREMWQTIAAGRVWHGEIVNRHKNGSLYWVATTIVPWLDPQGRPYQYIAIRTDITAQKEVELALEAARHRELETGYAIQRAMLIGEPPESLRAARAASYSEASQGIDGDFFAFTTLRDDCLELLVGDVMGKGVPAALVGAAVRTAYNQVVTELLSASLGSGELPPPERVVNTLHARLTPRLIELDVFVTLALYRFDFSAGTIRYVNAGHTEGLILRADGRVARVIGENLPLGVIEGERYVECAEPLGPGDALVVYSDGLTEARNADGKAFGDERVRSELIEPFRLGLPPNICLQALRRTAREFIGGGQLVDDQTVAMVAVPPRRAGERGSTDAFDLPWDARKLEPLRTRVAAAAVALKPERADGLVLASFEAATNVVRHVTPPFPDALLSCRVECGPDEVSVEIWYLGAAFAPPAEPTPDFSGESEGGFGLYIMQQAVSRVSHEAPMPGICCTRLVQTASGTAHAQRASDAVLSPPA